MTIIEQNTGTSPNLYIIEDANGFIKYSSNTLSWSEISVFPVTIVNITPETSPLIVRFESYLIINDPDKYFKIGSPNITIIAGDSTFHIVIYNIIYKGLIQNGTMDFNGYDNINVKNIYTHGEGSTLANGGGWICQSYFGKGSLNNKIENCSNYIEITGNGCGGICGEYADNLEITNCVNEALISGSNAGGICGSNAGDAGSCVITNCYNTGIVSGGSAGGICGSNYGSGSNGACAITNCYNTGIVSGSSAGGIFGQNSASNTIYVTLINCYTLHGVLSTTISYYFSISSSCYLPKTDGVWNDSDANAALIDVELTWFSTSPGTPYLLKSFFGNTAPPVTINQNASTSPKLYISQYEDGTLKHSIDNSSWEQISVFPVTIVNTTNSATRLIVSFEIDLTIRNDLNRANISSKYFICGSDYITFDGKLNNVTIINGNNYPGLIQNGEDNSSGYSNITLKNINLNISSSTLGDGAGWICQRYFGRGSSNNKIESCSNAGDINPGGGGGICGMAVAYESGHCEITDCYNTGEVTSNDSGGICGYGSASSGTCIITNCYNTGIVSGSSAGGICGGSVGGNGNCIITNCYNTGNVSGASSGGICGPSAGGNGKCIITNCYNTGIVNNAYVAAGICGYGSICTLTNCYTLYGTLAIDGLDGLTFDVTSTNCYVPTTEGIWDDEDAKSNLTGVPTL
jgi:fibronectin-binding autotransporter adhesin